ncbi:MAG TPA: cytochrome c3 family protein [Terriglobia bacterium]|nr:cytochrome c3 family protein [Terriglobia bacterium]
MSDRSLRRRVVVAAASYCLVAVAARLLISQEEGLQPFPSPTEAPPGAHYVGAAACAKCHPSETETAPATPMGHALEPAGDCTILRAHPRLAFREGPYSYEIVRQGDRSLFTVTDGRETISEPILWAFGLGNAGQTYIFKHHGSYYESRVSFFSAIQELDITVGHLRSVPPSLEAAAGRPISDDEARRCFGCHSTDAASASGLRVEHLIPGVTCESCHGPAADHVAAMNTGKLENLHIFNPGKLDPGDLGDFCGSCHRSLIAVQLAGTQGIADVRFQPYRLSLSRCYDWGDARISCLACHDPHRSKLPDAATVDQRCLACHSSSRATRRPPKTARGARHARACPVGKERCGSCHMPQYEIPGSHTKFTDHDIRVVKPGEPYPG